MSKLSTLTPIAAAFALSVAGVAHAADASPFAAKPVHSFTVADASQTEGKCGADKAKSEGHCGADKAKAKKEGKCGEGKCGANKKKTAAAEGKCGADKMKKEGNCGASKTAAPAASAATSAM